MELNRFRIVGPLLAAFVVSLAGPTGTAAPGVAGTRSLTSGRGALFGLFPGPNTPLYPITQSNTVLNGLPALGVDPEADLAYLPAMEAWQGRPNDVINVFSDWAGANPLLFGYWLPMIWDTYHAVPMITLWPSEPETGAVMTNADVAKGNYDAVIQAWATEFKQFISGIDASGQPAPLGGRRAYIRFAWEANSRFAQHSPAANASTCEELAANEATFVAMWRHVYEVIMSTGGFTRDQVAWVFSVWSTSADVPANCPNGASELVRAMYPGDNYVNWVGVDGYGGFPWNPNISPEQLLDPMITELRGITNRPMSINEVGTGTLTQPMLAPVQPINEGATPAQKGAWIADYFRYIKSAGVKMSLWFNVNKEADWAVFSETKAADPMSRGDCTYTSGATTYNTYCEYAKGVRSGYFISPDLSNPRLLSNAEFLGH